MWKNCEEKSGDNCILYGDKMKHIVLTKGQITQIDDIDYPSILEKPCFAIPTKNGYYAKCENEFIHRIVMENILQRPLQSDEEIDHIDLDGLNNKRENLRLATRATNNQNRGKFSNNKSGYKGVSWRESHSKWRATIRLNGRQKFLGQFDDVIEAAKAYDTAAKELFGEFAVLNFPE